jgi:hypothetical protein
MEHKMPVDKNPHPMLRVTLPNGDMIYPRCEKDTQGKWTLKNAAFWSSLIERQKTSPLISADTSNQTTPSKE